jgi:predicted esterase
VFVEPIDASEQPPTFVLRGATSGHALIFLHGLCGHAQGYVQSFQFSAARFGVVIAPQGDVVCGRGPWASWSSNVAALETRIDRALTTLGRTEPRSELALIGYSLGATRALDLVRRSPGRYTRLILIAAPSVPSARGLAGVRRALMMAGERDRKDLMQRGVRVMRAAGITSEFMALPGAAHGEMGPDAERVMGEALDWLFAE